MTLKYTDFQGNITVQGEASKPLWRPEGRHFPNVQHFKYTRYLIYCGHPKYGPFEWS